MAPIVFIHSLSVNEQEQWLAQFRQLMPDEKIVLAHELTDQEALTIEIAIVANPEVAELERFANLVWVQSLWAGVDAMVERFRQVNRNKAIPTKLVRLIDPFLADTMAEAALAWTLYLHRNMPEYRTQQQQCTWQPLPYSRAQDVRVSVLGTGELGLASMQLLARHGYQVSGWSRSAKKIAGVNHYNGDEGLQSMLATSDILLCLLPLTPDTTKLLNRQTLSLLPKGAKLINFARGGIVDHQALQMLLDENHIAQAVLDVFEQEPLAAEHPLWRHPKVTVLPHISATTNVRTASQVTAQNILTYRLSGDIAPSVDLVKGY